MHLHIASSRTIAFSPIAHASAEAVSVHIGTRMGSNPKLLTPMINYRKLKSQIHKGGIGYVFEPTSQQLENSDWQIWTYDAVSKRKLLRLLVPIIRDKTMNHWRKEFML